MIVYRRKTIILLLLFACTLFLTGKFVVGLSSVQNDYRASVEVFDAQYYIESIFKPESYIISFGGGIYTKNAYEYNDILWDSIQTRLSDVIAEFDFEKNLSVLSRDEWQDIIQNRGVYLRLPFNLKTEEISSLLDVNRPFLIEDALIDGIWISVYNDDGIYLSDADKQSYYRLNNRSSYAVVTQKIAEIIDDIETQEIVEYKRINDLFSLDLLENKAELVDEKSILTDELFPLTNKNMYCVKVRPEFTMDIRYDELFKDFAQKTFGKNFNFVKKMKDVDESIIYIYGYANKALRIGSDGSIEYTQSDIKKTENIEISFKDAITRALHTIDIYGGIPKGLYLSSFNKTKDDINRQVWEFNFDYRILDVPVISNNERYYSGVYIQIVDGKVAKFTRKIYELDEGNIPYLLDESISFNEVLDINSKLIQQNYLSVKPEFSHLSEQELWTFIVRDISNINIGYEVDNEDNVLYPIWKFNIQSDKYKFPLYR